MNHKMIYLLMSVCLGFLIGFLACEKNPFDPEPEEDEIIFKPEVVKLDEPALNSIESIDSTGVITFAVPGKTAASLISGNVIFSQPIEAVPHGFLRKVTGLSESGGKLQLATTDATLEDVFEKATLSLSKRLTYDDVDSNAPLSKGTARQRTMDNGFYWEIDHTFDRDGNRGTKDDQIKTTGELEINPSFQFNFKIDTGGLQELRFVNTTEQKARMQLSYATAIAYNPEPQSLDLIEFSPITIWISWFPLVVKPILSVDYGVEVSASVGVTAEVIQQATLTAGLEYKNNEWKPVQDVSKALFLKTPRAHCGRSLNCTMMSCFR